MSDLAANQARFRLELESCADVLHVVRFELREAVSALYELELELVCENRELSLADLIRKPALLTIRGERADAAPRFVHGIVRSASQGRQDARIARYRLCVVPRVWTLHHRQDCRIFQDKSTREIVGEVLRGAGIPADAVRFSLSGELPVRQYCVQYRESDWDFVARLLEDDGCYFYFEHAEGGHTLVVGDGPGGYQPLPGDSRLLHDETASDPDVIHQFEFTEYMGPGKLSVRDYDFTKPDEVLEGEAVAEPEDLEVYDYPGGYDAAALARRKAKIRLQELRARRKLGEGRSTCPRLTPGHTFALADFEGRLRDDLHRDYLVLAVRHQGDQPQAQDLAGFGLDSKYDNGFECVPADVSYRPRRVTRRPRIGAQTAIVVGPASEEIFTDEHGRVKVQFHWDRLGKRDERSSCWVRVSQAWAGHGWGAMWLPRIGHEVIVEFLEGDPDRPIITGRVYGKEASPYPLPDEKTKSTCKSDSSLGGGGSNEIRFEDAKGSEELFVHAQRDWTIAVGSDKSQTVGHDETHDVGNDEKHTVGRDEAHDVGHDRATSVGHDEKLSVGADMSIAVGGGFTGTVTKDASLQVGGGATATIGKSSTVQVGKDASETVAGAKSSSVGKDSRETIGGAKAVSVAKDSNETVGKSRALNVTDDLRESAGKQVSIAAGKKMGLQAGQDFDLQVGKKGSIVVNDKLTITSGSATVTIQKNGDITIKGGKLSISASGVVTIKGSKVKLN